MTRKRKSFTADDISIGDEYIIRHEGRDVPVQVVKRFNTDCFSHPRPNWWVQAITTGERIHVKAVTKFRKATKTDLCRLLAAHVVYCSEVQRCDEQ